MSVDFFFGGRKHKRRGVGWLSIAAAFKARNLFIQIFYYLHPNLIIIVLFIVPVLYSITNQIIYTCVTSTKDMYSYPAANESINFEFITQLLDHNGKYHRLSRDDDEKSRKLRKKTARKFNSKKKITENEFYIKSTSSKIDEGWRECQWVKRKWPRGKFLWLYHNENPFAWEDTHQQVKSGYNVHILVGSVSQWWWWYSRVYFIIRMRGI